MRPVPVTTYSVGRWASPRARRSSAYRGAASGKMDSGNQKSFFVARNVPAPIRTASAHARSRPMRNRSAAEPPLTMAPDSRPTSENATTPSTDSTKLATTHSGGSQRSLPYALSSAAGRPIRTPTRADSNRTSS